VTEKDWAGLHKAVSAEISQIQIGKLNIEQAYNFFIKLVAQ